MKEKDNEEIKIEIDAKMCKTKAKRSEMLIEIWKLGWNLDEIIRNWNTREHNEGEKY